MTAEIISVGTEILLGNIVNTNAAFLAEQCASLGLSCYYQTVVGDNEKRLLEAIKTALLRSDIVILSGGLGPTEDDLTKETAAKAAGLPLILDEHTKVRIQSYFDGIGRVPTGNNWKQALIPEGAVVLDNDNGTAPGLIVKTDGKYMFLLPGPPDELIPMFNNQAAPFIRKLSDEVIVSETLKLCGVGESAAADKIKDMLETQTNPTIAPYAKIGEVHLRITAKAASEEEAKALIAPVLSELSRRFGEAIYTSQADEMLEAVLVKLLKKQKLTITTAESCTGGMLCARLVNVPGASDVLNLSAVTYANEAKQRILNVSKDVLEKYGAVSEQTARAMAEGAAAFAGADVALSVTGIAGPDGGTKEKPVGLVYIGCFACGETEVIECRFKGSRRKVREQTVIKAMDFARKRLLHRA